MSEVKITLIDTLRTRAAEAEEHRDACKRSMQQSAVAGDTAKVQRMAVQVECYAAIAQELRFILRDR